MDTLSMHSNIYVYCCSSKHNFKQINCKCNRLFILANGTCTLNLLSDRFATKYKKMSCFLEQIHCLVHVTHTIYAQLKETDFLADFPLQKLT